MPPPRCSSNKSNTVRRRCRPPSRHSNNSSLHLAILCLLSNKFHLQSNNLHPLSSHFHLLSDKPRLLPIKFHLLSQKAPLLLLPLSQVLPALPKITGN